MTVLHWLLIVAAGLAAGVVNALAGGGTLISFPILLAIGLPPVSANVTNTIALWPGYLGATLAQRADLTAQRARLFRLIPVAVVGGWLGAALLLSTDDGEFSKAIPWMILVACALLAGQDRLRRLVVARREGFGALPIWVLCLVTVSAMYGGYFGAGMSVIVLAVLGLGLQDTLPRLNALKQAVALAANGAAALQLAFSSRVHWSVVLVLGLSALLGGALGGRFAAKLPPLQLRRIVVAFGLCVAVFYLLR